MGHLLPPSSNEDPTNGPKPLRKKFILCFDGTGNEFSGTTSDSNILKIYSMLDKTDDGTQFHYYQPGIGTYTTRRSLSSSGIISRTTSWYRKVKDSALGITVDEHVMAGYRFLMRYYQTGDDIYFFGFSRGAYIARFLAEMLDHIGLLSAGNEELVRFVWKTFAKWQSRQGGQSEEERNKAAEMLKYMTTFRETFSRPVRRIRFLGLFDTVNSVSKFEAAWMQRSKRFPYTARSSAIVIRHAVAIDERRAKFRQDLIYQKRRCAAHGDHNSSDGRTTTSGGTKDVTKPNEFRMRFRRRPSVPAQIYPAAYPTARFRARGRSRPGTRGSSAGPSIDNDSCNSDDEDEALEQDIEELWFPGGHADIGGGWPPDESGPVHTSLAHGPLVWMVREAQNAGLVFMKDKLREFGCYYEDDVNEMGNKWLADVGHEGTSAVPPLSTIVPEIDVNDTIISAASVSDPTPAQTQLTTDPQTSGSNADYFATLHRCATRGLIHDCLTLRSTLPPLSVLAWNIMEYLPFRRMDLQPDGSGRWRVIRWPLPMGEVRDMPDDARVHGSAIVRLMTDATYRPGNLVDGGGGREQRIARGKWAVGDWVCLGDGHESGLTVGGGNDGKGGFGEMWVRRKWWERDMEVEGIL